MEYMLLKEVCDIRDGTHNSPKYVQSGYPLVTSKNIVDGRLDLSVVGKVSEEDYNKINERSKVDIGDIIMPMIGTIGNPIIIADFCDFAIKNVALIKFPNKNVYNRYIWYFLKSTAFKRYIKEKNKGGTQKFLSLGDIRNIQVPLISFSKQIELIEKLDLINDIISLRKKELLLLDNIIKARFVEMFCNKGYPVLGWNDVFNTTTGKLDSNAMVENGDYPFFTCAKEVFRIDKYAFEQEALILAGNNAAGKYDVKYYKGKFNAYQRTYILSLKQDWSYRLFQYQLEDKLVYLQKHSLGGLTKYLTLKILGDLSFIIPPIDKQAYFEKFVEQVNKSKLITYYHHKSIYTKPQLCCKMVIVNDFLNTKRF